MCERSVELGVNSHLYPDKLVKSCKIAVGPAMTGVSHYLVIT